MISSAHGFSGFNMTASIGKKLDDEKGYIADLSYIPDFIDHEAEAQLLQTIDQQAWINDLRRRVQHYGYRYDYKARSINADFNIGDIPPWLMPYCVKLKNDGLFHKIPDQVIINEYQAGQGIAAHIDCVPCFKEVIASLSLGSPCIMDFSNNKTGEKIPQLLEPRSLVLLSGAARYEWKHGIASRKIDKYEGKAIARSRRISLTFRNMII